MNIPWVFKELFPALKVLEELTETSNISSNNDLSVVAFLFGIFFKMWFIFVSFHGGGREKPHKTNLGKVFNFTLMK